MDDDPPDFSKFVNMLYSKGLKLSVGVSSFSDLSIVCLSFLRCHGNYLTVVMVILPPFLGQN